MTKITALPKIFNTETAFEEFTGDIKYEAEIDWNEVNTRIRTTIAESGTSVKDVAALVGLDIGAMDYMEKYNKLPKLKTAIIVAAYLGIPASWVLTGKGESPIIASSNKFKDSTAGAVVQGASAGTLIINNGNDGFSPQKRELIRIFDSLSIRDQTRLLNVAYEIEDGEWTA